MEIALTPAYDSYHSYPSNEVVVGYLDNYGNPLIVLKLLNNGESGPRTLHLPYDQFLRAVRALR